MELSGFTFYHCKFSFEPPYQIYPKSEFIREKNDPSLRNQISFLIIDDCGFNFRRYLFNPTGRASKILPSSCKGARCFIFLSRSKLKR
ncbi:hypothetical protein ES288_D13G063400v1 [Gossypium darwinii]|uniref:Uncharacterized protein n=1 Tax=Gossypium darwinii TaxID=34276 RepID=A0A5D1ZXK4_GOSDA|nr:hypothetical protein ES288_D13G063400v1 [Gossypium darwinii]